MGTPCYHRGAQGKGPGRRIVGNVCAKIPGCLQRGPRSGRYALQMARMKFI